MYLGKITKILRKVRSNKIFKLVEVFAIHILVVFNLAFNITGAISLIILSAYLIFIIKLLSNKGFVSFSMYKTISFIVIILLLSDLILLIVAYNITKPKIKILEDNPKNYYFIKGANIKYTSKSQNIPKSQNAEFKHTKATNKEGFTDKEWRKDKKDGHYRILCIGDSFTEGIGAEFDSSYPILLNSKLNKKFKNIEVLNAGRGGSDPFFDFTLLKDKIIEFKPDIVLQSFTTNDFYQDIVIRGGFNRFQKDGGVKRRNDYWWESIYFRSSIFRILLTTLGGYDDFLIKSKNYPQLYDKMKEECVELFKAYKNLATTNDFKLILFTFPFQNDFTVNNKNDNFYSELSKELKELEFSFQNLQPCYEEYIAEHGGTYKDYYWEKDGHHNAKGYKMMANCIEEILLPVLNSQ